MTILSNEKTLQQPRLLLWRIASQFGQASRWMEGMKKTVQCDYEPRHRLAKIKNLMFLRHRYWERLEASPIALERVAIEQTM